MMNSESHLKHLWTLLKSKHKLIRTYTKTTTNTGEINTRRKRERPKKQRKVKYILEEGCGGLDGGNVLRVGRTAEDRMMYRRYIKAATS